MGWLREAFGRRAATPAPAAAAAPGAAECKARGNEALGQGQLAQAARWYEQGVQADPADASLRLNLGFVLLEQGQPQAAIECLQQALALRGSGDGFAHEAHYLLGRAEAAAGRTQAALPALQEALRLQPAFAEALEEGVRVLHQLQRHAEAADWARRLLDLRADRFTRFLLATELSLAKQDAEAAALLAQVCAEEPGHLDASALLFHSLMQMDRLDEALAEAQRLLAVTGPHPAPLVNLSAVLEKMNRLDEALVHLDEALRLDPRRRDAIVNKVAVLTGLVRMREAAATAEAGLRLYPDDADLHWGLCIACLTQGEFTRGWQEHEWRTRSIAFRGSEMELEQPRWQGESLAGRSIFLYGEQGFGDNIQFLRYVPLVAQQAGTVYLQVMELLEPLMTQLPANVRLLPQHSLLPPIAYHCPLMSLPAVLGMTEANLPKQVPYLQADPARVQRWRERLPQGTLNVGIAWSGKPTHTNDRNRSMTLAVFRALAAEGCRFVTVQPQLRDADRVTLAGWDQALDFGSELRDFSDTAALIEALDLVVSVDTSVAHLAGALARPVWILLPHAPDWRWLLEREDSPWYPTARLFRQGPDRSWDPVLARVRRELAALKGR